MSVARYRCELSGLVGGPGLTTFHADTLGAGYSDQSFVDAIEAFLTSIAPIVSDTISWTGQSVVDVMDVTTSALTARNPVTGFVVDGTHAAELLPPTSQGLVEWSTGAFLDGREVRGRTFIPGPVIDVSEDPGVPTAGYVGGLTTNANALIAAFPSLSIYSRHRDADPDHTPPIAERNGSIHAVNAAFGWSKWAVLRGRRDG